MLSFYTGGSISMIPKTLVSFFLAGALMGCPKVVYPPSCSIAKTDAGPLRGQWVHDCPGHVHRLVCEKQSTGAWLVWPEVDSRPLPQYILSAERPEFCR